MPYLIILAILAGGVYLSLKGQHKDPLKDVNVWPYVRKPKPMNPLEINFYGALRRFLDERLVICPKMALDKILYVPDNARLKRSLKEKIQGQAIDFAICDSDLTLVCLIHLAGENDPDDMVQADLEKIAENASLPLFRFEPQFEYTAELFQPVNDLFRSGNYQ